MQAFKEAETRHRDASRLGAEKKFKGGLADQSEEVIKLHTTHHLLLKALQVVLGEEVKQRGSNITAERLRIDINYPDKLSDEQMSKVEAIVNEKIDAGLEITRVEMPKQEAEKIGAEREFGQKYPEIVSVYQIKEKDGTIFSKEFCGGPHVKNTSEITAGGKHFKITKQENIGGGLRRLKGILTK
jgi:alanyl-tRNA synthetase